MPTTSSGSRLCAGARSVRSAHWAVPAYGQVDTDWAGRARLDDSSWPAVAIEITTSPTQVALATRALQLSVTLDGFRMDWALSDGTIFARDRATQPYFLGQKTHAFKHAMARAPGDRHYGLGDKTGPLDLTGRRLRCAMRDSLGFDPERGDPLYKNWPFLIVRDAASGVSHGVFYDNGAEGSFDLGCEHDNYFGRYRVYEAEDGDLDFYLILGPRLADVTAKFLALTGRTALPPRWSLGFAQTAMALADAPDAQSQIQGVIDAAKALDAPISSFHFGSGYTSIGKKRYVFTWNHAKFPEPKALTRAFADAHMKVVANVKPCLLDNHPRYGEVAAAGGFIAGGDDHAPLKSHFWDGEGAHVDFTSPAGVAWWKEGLTRQVLDYGVDAGWNDNNEYGLWDDDAICAGFGEPTPLALLRPVQALLMTRATREAQLAAKPNVRPFTVTRAGGPGLQRYAQTWSGDNTTSWESLKWNFRTGLGMSLSGMFNIGHDVGGFAGPPPDPELLIRWTQAGLLHPRFLMNSWKDDGVTTSPWLRPEALPAIRDALRLSLQRDRFSARGAYPCAGADLRSLRGRSRLFRRRRRRDVRPLPARRAGPARRRARGRGLSPARPRKLARFLDRARLRSRSNRDDPRAVGSAAAARAGWCDRRDDRQRRRLFAPARRALAGLARFPGTADGASRAVLIEDDGISLVGASARVAIALSWTASRVCVEAGASGNYTLPYQEMRVILPEDETRTVELSGADGIGLRL